MGRADLRERTELAMKEKNVKAGDRVSWGTVNARQEGLVTDNGKGGLEVVVGMDGALAIGDVIFSASFTVL